MKNVKKETNQEEKIVGYEKKSKDYYENLAKLAIKYHPEIAGMLEERAAMKGE